MPCLLWDRRNRMKCKLKILGLAVLGESLHKSGLRNVRRELVGCAGSESCLRLCSYRIVCYNWAPIAVAARCQAIAQREQGNQGMFQCGLHQGKDTTFIFWAKESVLIT